MGGCRGSASVLAVVLAIGSLGACTADRTARASGGARTGSANPSAGSAVPEPTDFRNGPADRPSQGDALVSVATIARKLDVPWGVAFLPDRGALVTERRTLRILKVGPDRQANGDLTVAPQATIREADSNNEGGLLGIAASPSFARDRTVFIYYTTTVDNRIARLRIGDRPQPIVTGLPHAGVHDGGRLAFGPDGYLYASTGDASRNDEAQRLDSLGGKILRMTVDGKPAPGNPFRDSLVWSYGHRNPEGMAWDDKGNMYVAEIGEAVWDELNLVQPGKNYGWPKVQGIGNDPAYVDPLVTWHPEVGVSAGVAIHDRTAVITCLRGQRIYLVGLDGTGTRGIYSRRVDGGGADANVRWRPDAGVTGRPIEALTTEYGRLRTAISAPDGSIWLTTSNRDGRNEHGPAEDDDRILRLTLRAPATASGR